MAMLFLLEMQDEWKLKAPLLALTDVREIFEVIMPKRRVSDREILKLIEQKHMDRQLDYLTIKEGGNLTKSSFNLKEN